MEKSPAPKLLPILRSRQQAEILAWLLDNPDREASLTELSDRLDIPASSVHREVERAEQVGILVSRRIGATRLVRANGQSRYFDPLRQLLVMSYGVPERLTQALSKITGVQAAYIFGSWAASYEDVRSSRSVGDIDVLVLGNPQRDKVYQNLAVVEPQAGFPVQVTFRSGDWLKALLTVLMDLSRLVL